jgi:hypothetical protein
LKIWQIEDEFKRQYPEYKYHSWLPRRYAEMKSKISNWERRFDHSIVLLLVAEEKRTTRSPGKLWALDEWLQKNELQGLSEN